MVVLWDKPCTQIRGLRVLFINILLVVVSYRDKQI